MLKKKRINYLDTSPMSIKEFFNRPLTKTKGFRIQTIITCNECGSTECEKNGLTYRCSSCGQLWFDDSPLEVKI